MAIEPVAEPSRSSRNDHDNKLPSTIGVKHATLQHHDTAKRGFSAS